ncbi:MAG TPA: DUF2188 domain-containing protein [Phycisphaerae bacterium]|nr:DUF2188 domain-containing protein [Phycisphaerae bacterium]
MKEIKMAARQVYQSVLTRDGWQVRKSKKVVSSHATQKECEAAAIELGRAAYEKGGIGQAVLHKADGTIREERTYGKDPERTPG